MRRASAAWRPVGNVFSDEFLKFKGGALGSPVLQTGLIFPSNVAAGSDIRLVWDSANLLSRTAQTAIWKAKLVQQTGYYAWCWQTSNDGTWHASTYEVGNHPFPCDGTFDGNGQALGGTAGAGIVHYYETAGLGANDFIATAGGSAYLVTKGAWYTQARTIALVTVSAPNDTIRHKFYPDVDGNPSFVITQDILASSLATPTTPAFIFGASPWRSGLGGGGASATDEASSGTYRSLALFSAALSISDIATEAGTDSNSAQTAAAIASVWYINKNPTPADVTDKSGAGHSPSWANANRPTQYTVYS